MPEKGRSGKQPVQSGYSQTKKLCVMAVLTAIALTIFVLESQIPSPVPIPGGSNHRRGPAPAPLPVRAFPGASVPPSFPKGPRSSRGFFAVQAPA